MTKEQREILISNVKQDGGEYSILSIEYPSNVEGYGLQTCLKIVTRMIESDECFADWYNEQGATINTRSYFARQS
jgi:hypothetical protein